MAYPVTPSELTQDQSVNVIAEAEAAIIQCMASFLCNELLPGIEALVTIEDQVELTRSVLCAYTCKEKSIAKVIDALANKILADKGLVPGGGGSDGCNCGGDC